MAWHVGGSATAPRLIEDGEITVATYGAPRPARDFIFPPIDALDGGTTMAVADADTAAGGREAVWTQHTVDPGDGTVAMRWYELLPALRRAKQVGTVEEPGVDVFDGAVSPADGGTAAVVGFNRSGLFLLPEMDARIHAPGGLLPSWSTRIAAIDASSP